MWKIKRKKPKSHSILNISKTAAKITAADPATLNLFKTAPLASGAGASDGGKEIEDGEVAGAPAGDSEVDGGGDGGDLTVAGEGEGPLVTEGEVSGDGENAFGGVAADEPVGEEAGVDAGDWAIVKLTKSAATSIDTAQQRAIIEREKLRF